MVALGAGCEQRPKSGSLLGLSGDLFATAPVTITEPPVNEADLKDDPSPTGMTAGAIVGIAVGAALLFLGSSVLFFVYYRKQKKLYGDDLGSEYDNHSRGHSRVGSQQPMMGGPGGYSAFDLERYSASNYELRSQQGGFHKNADYYDEVEKEMQMQTRTTRLPNYNFDPNHQMRGPNGALPTHPAYIPKSMGRTSRESTPEPPRLTSQPSLHRQKEAYAANPYLNAEHTHAQPPGLSIPASTHQPQQHRRSASIPPPPPRQPPLQQQQYPIPQQQPARSKSRNSIQVATRNSVLPGPPAPPPPPPPRAPRLTLPSMRKLRVPKKYAPPQITVEEPTPVSSPAGGEVPIGLEISDPLPQHLQRFADNQHPGAAKWGGDPSTSASQHQQQRWPITTALSMPDHGGVRQQHAVDRRHRNNTSDAEYVEIHTSKSDIYG